MDVDLFLKVISEGRQMSTLQASSLAAATALLLSVNYIIAPYYYPSIYYHWPYIGIAVAVSICMFCLATIRSVGLTGHMVYTRLLLCLLILAYAIHQYEENGVDLKDRKFAFTPFSNEMFDTFLPLFKCHDVKSCAFNAYNVMAYNTIGIWLPLMALPFLFVTYPLYALFVGGLTLVNAIGHVCACILTGTYSPGVASSLVLVTPVAILCSHRVIRYMYHGEILLWFIVILAGVWSHSCIAVLVLLVDMMGWLPREVWPLFTLFFLVVMPITFAKVVGYKLDELNAKRSRNPVEFREHVVV